MRLRKRYLPLAAALGAAVAVIPAMNGLAQEPTVEAGGSGYGNYYWSPSSVQIATNGSVTFKNMSSSVPHGVVWKSTPATPTCSGVPINEGKTSWSGSCTFSQAGTYSYYCYVHGESMSGTITVGTGTTTTSSSSSSSRSSTSTTTSSTYTNPYESTSSSTSSSYTSPTTSTTVSYSSSSTPVTSGSSSKTTSSTKSSSYPSEEEGGASPASGLVIASSQHGSSVHGSVKISKAGAGGRLQVELLATSASLAKAKKHKHASMVEVGRSVHRGLHAGKVSFSVALSSKAKSAVHRHHHLALTVKITVTPTHGKALVMSRSVTVHG